MPAAVVPNDAWMSGPGYLYEAVLATALPGSGAGGVVAASKFSDAWAAPWRLIGITRNGSSFSYQVNAEGIVVAEYLDPLAYKSTGRTIGVQFDMAQITTKSFAVAMNGGTTTTVSGTGATTLSKYGPPTVGAEQRRMIGWESETQDVRAIFYQAFQGGEVTWNNQKAPEIASLPVNFMIEQPASGDPFNIFTAGTVRVGT